MGNKLKEVSFHPDVGNEQRLSSPGAEHRRDICQGLQVPSLESVFNPVQILYEIPIHMAVLAMDAIGFMFMFPVSLRST